MKLISKIRRSLKEGTLIENSLKTVSSRIITSNLLYIFDKARRETKKYQQDIPKINTLHYKAGNYYLDKRIPLHENSVVYSLGILTDITFDLAVSQKFGCKIHMYDPTPRSKKYMEGHANNKLLKFNPVAVWTENTVLKFYQPPLGGSASAVFQGGSDFFEAEAYTMDFLMKKNGHQKIDVFKADIEGAALPIIEQMISNKNFPTQIVAEFERPEGDIALTKDFFERLSYVRDQLKTEGYEEFLIPRDLAKYFSLELLFVKPNDKRH